MVETGTYEELVKRSSSFSRLLENIHQQQERQEQEQMENVSSTYRRLSSRGESMSQREIEDDVQSDSGTIEAKQEGSVKSHVYLGYLRAGIPVVLGVFLLLVAFGVREATFFFFSRWLADWSDDETHRHRQLNNCSERINAKITKIRSMNETEWNAYRDHRFHIFCG